MKPIDGELKGYRSGKSTRTFQTPPIEQHEEYKLTNWDEKEETKQRYKSPEDASYGYELRSYHESRTLGWS